MTSFSSSVDTYRFEELVEAGPGHSQQFELRSLAAKCLMRRYGDMESSIHLQF